MVFLSEVFSLSHEIIKTITSNDELCDWAIGSINIADIYSKQFPIDIYGAYSEYHFTSSLTQYLIHSEKFNNSKTS